MRHYEPADVGGRAKTADALLFFGGIFGLLGGLANIAIGFLHYLGIPLPFGFLEWPMIMPFIFPGSLWQFIYVGVPLGIGIVGTLFTVICMSRRLAIRTEPKGTGTALIVCGGVVAGCCWGFGGLLIIFAGIFSILYWTDIRPRRSRRSRRAPRVAPRPVRTPPPRTAPRSTVRVVSTPSKVKAEGYCPSCSVLITPGDRFCSSCGVVLE